jgi:hypothetical protein
VSGIEMVQGVICDLKEQGISIIVISHARGHLRGRRPGAGHEAWPRGSGGNIEQTSLDEVLPMIVTEATAAARLSLADEG